MRYLTLFEDDLSECKYKETELDGLCKALMSDSGEVVILGHPRMSHYDVIALVEAGRLGLVIIRGNYLKTIHVERQPGRFVQVSEERVTAHIGPLYRVSDMAQAVKVFDERGR